MIYDKIETAIENEYKNIRSNNRHEMLMRRDKVASLKPEIIQWLNQITLSGVNAAKLVLKFREDGGKSRKNVITDSISTMRESNSELKNKIENALIELGLEKNYLGDIYKCECCRDNGFTEKGKCSCYYEKRRRYIYEASYLNDIDKRENFETFRTDIYSKNVNKTGERSDYDIMSLNYRICKKYADNFGKNSNNIVLTGNSGVGKTFLCSAIADTVAKNGNIVVYISAKRFFDTLIRANFDSSNYDSYDKISPERELSELIYECDLLIVDDLGTEAMTKLTDPQLFDVINDRKIKGRKTVISTNLNENEIIKRYSERIYSRIVEYFVVLKCVGDDMRRKQK